MPRGLNKVILIGNLGDEPIIRKTNNGGTVANFSMVTNETRRNMQTGENTEYAEWHRIVLWNRLAEVAEQYMHKGSRIYLEGKIRNRSYMDKNNQKKYVTEIQADEVLLLDSRQDGNEISAPSRSYTNTPPAQAPVQPQSVTSGTRPDSGYDAASYQSHNNDQQIQPQAESSYNRNSSTTNFTQNAYQPAPSQTTYGQQDEQVPASSSPIQEPIMTDDEIPF